MSSTTQKQPTAEIYEAQAKELVKKIGDRLNCYVWIESATPSQTTITDSSAVFDIKVKYMGIGNCKGKQIFITPTVPSANKVFSSELSQLIMIKQDEVLGKGGVPAEFTGTATLKGFTIPGETHGTVCGQVSLAGEISNTSSMVTEVFKMPPQPVCKSMPEACVYAPGGCFMDNTGALPDVCPPQFNLEEYKKATLCDVLTSTDAKLQISAAARAEATTAVAKENAESSLDEMAYFSDTSNRPSVSISDAQKTYELMNYSYNTMYSFKEQHMSVAKELGRAMSEYLQIMNAMEAEKNSQPVIAQLNESKYRLEKEIQSLKENHELMDAQMSEYYDRIRRDMKTLEPALYSSCIETKTQPSELDKPEAKGTVTISMVTPLSQRLAAIVAGKQAGRAAAAANAIMTSLGLHEAQKLDEKDPLASLYNPEIEELNKEIAQIKGALTSAMLSRYQKNQIMGNEIFTELYSSQGCNMDRDLAKIGHNLEAIEEKMKKNEK